MLNSVFLVRLMSFIVLAMYTHVLALTYTHTFFGFRPLSLSPSLQQEFGAFERRDVKLQEDMVHLRAQVKKLQVRFDTLVYYSVGGGWSRVFICVSCLNL